MSEERGLQVDMDAYEDAKKEAQVITLQASAVIYILRFSFTMTFPLIRFFLKGRDQQPRIILC